MDQGYHMNHMVSAQSNNVQLMLVNVPANVRPGEQMVVMAPQGQQYMVVVPQGAGPGTQFQIAVPRTDNMMGCPPSCGMMGGGLPPSSGGMFGGYGGGMHGMMPPGMPPGAMPPGAMPPGMMPHCMPPGGMPPGMMGNNPAAVAAAAAAAAAANAYHDGRGGGGGGRGRGGRKRKEKDMNRAPRQPSAYNLFMKTEVARIKQVPRGNSAWPHPMAKMLLLNDPAPPTLPFTHLPARRRRRRIVPSPTRTLSGSPRAIGAPPTPTPRSGRATRCSRRRSSS